MLAIWIISTAPRESHRQINPYLVPFLFSICGGLLLLDDGAGSMDRINSSDTLIVYVFVSVCRQYCVTKLPLKTLSFGEDHTGKI